MTQEWYHSYLLPPRTEMKVERLHLWAGKKDGVWGPLLATKLCHRDGTLSSFMQPCFVVVPRGKQDSNRSLEVKAWTGFSKALLGSGIHAGSPGQLLFSCSCLPLRLEYVPLGGLSHVSSASGVWFILEIVLTENNRKLLARRRIKRGTVFTLGAFPIVPGYIAKELKIVVISSLWIGPSWGDKGQPKVDLLLQGAPVRSTSSTFTLFWEQFLLAVFLLPHSWSGLPSQLINSSDLSRQPVLNQPVLDGLLP